MQDLPIDPSKKPLKEPFQVMQDLPIDPSKKPLKEPFQVMQGLCHQHYWLLSASRKLQLFGDGYTV